jgi:hypothetical protein
MTPVLDVWLRALATAALCLTLAWLPRTLVSVGRHVGGLAARERRWLFGGWLVALVARQLVPGAWIKVFTGYELADAVVAGGPVAKYGAGFGAMLGNLWSLTGPSEKALFAVQGLLGTFSVVLAGALIGRWLARPGTTAAATWAMALLPVALRVDCSEAETVLATFAFVQALLLAYEALRTGDRADAWGAMLSWTLAAHTRPEFVLAGPAAWFLLLRTHPQRSPGRAPMDLPHAVAAAGLVALQVAHLAVEGMARRQLGELPATVEPGWWWHWPVMLVIGDLRLDPLSFPITLTAGAVWAVRRLRKTGQREPLGLLVTVVVLGPVLLAPALVDPVPVSMPRLELPILLLSAGAFAGCATVPLAEVRLRLQVAAAVALAITAALNVWWLWRVDHSDTEDALLRRVADSLRGQRGTLHVPHWDDDDWDQVARAYPGFRFHLPHARLRIRPLQELAYREPGEKRWVFLGLRCYATKDPARLDHAGPALFEEHMSCRRARQRPGLRPLWTLDLPNDGAVHFFWWPIVRATLPVGLYALDAPPQIRDTKRP